MGIGAARSRYFSVFSFFNGTHPITSQISLPTIYRITVTFRSMISQIDTNGSSINIEWQYFGLFFFLLNIDVSMHV